MTQPKTVDGKVLQILRDCPEARYNDIFNMLVLVGYVKMSDRIIREMMGL